MLSISKLPRSSLGLFCSDTLDIGQEFGEIHPKSDHSAKYLMDELR